MNIYVHQTKEVQSILCKILEKYTGVHSLLLLKIVFEILTRNAGQKNVTKVK